MLYSHSWTYFHETLQAMIMGCHPDERYIQSTSELVAQHVNSNYDYLKVENGTSNQYVGSYATEENCGRGIGHHRWKIGHHVPRQTPPPVIEQTPPPVVEQTPPPAIEQTPPPVVEQTPPPVIRQMPPLQEPPLQEPPLQEPPLQEPPAQEPPAQEPPAHSGQKVKISRNRTTSRYGQRTFHDRDAGRQIRMDRFGRNIAGQGGRGHGHGM